MARGLRGERRLMGTFLGGFVLPLLLLGASLLDWSLISLTNLLIFLAIQLSAANRGSNSWRVYILLWCTIFFSFIAIVAQIIFSSIWCIEGNDWKVADTWWAKVIGFVRIQPMGSRSVIFFIVIQLSVGLIAFVEVHGSSNDRGSCWSNFSSTVEQIGSPIRIACCLLLPAIQLVVGISHPSWIFLPFFVCSCVGLVDWSLTSNFLGLFRWWRILLFYACFSIFLFCTYQLPLKLPAMAITVADFIGLYKIDMKPELPELCSSISLIVFFLMLSSIKCNLDEMDSMLTLADNTLAERLLPPRHSFFIREFPSGVRHTNALLRGLVFRIFSINFFTYGFPVLLIALSLWSLSFASICAFGLLAYVGYVLFTFPSLFKLHRLNGLLLVFILLWAVSTYIFNVAFTFLNKELRKDMEIWETIGLWHYPIPGLFLFAQFCLGVFVSICNLVNNSVFLYLNNEGRQSLNDDSSFEDKEDTKVLIIATLAWGLRKCSRAITLALIFLRATKPGYIHAVYLCFFLLYLLSHSITRKIHQALILFCGAHYSLLYLLQLDLISKTLEQRGSMTILVLSQLGIVVDDPRTLVSYYLVFIFSSLKLRSDHLNGFSESHTYHQMMSQRKNASVWRDLSFETKSFWTFLDYMRLYLYCHLLDIVLALILITGTMEYDILHLGYLGFALVYFRMRLEILKKKNQIFRYLRIYNLILIVLSLAYQSPFLGDFSSSKCGAVDYIYEVIGFYKYDYGFEIKSRSALVEIIIFLLVSMQSYIFSSKEFEYVARYLETEQVGAMVREQEKRAARKAAQLQDFHKSEEDKRHRNVQVEKMKSEMLNLQTQLKFMNYSGNVTDVSAHNEGLRQRRSFSQNIGNCDNGLDNEFKSTMWDQEVSGELESSFYFPASNVLKNGSLTPEALDIDGSPFSARRHSSLTMELLKVPSKSISEISELPERYANIEACADQSRKRKGVENPLVSAVQLLGDGVSQVQSLGNQAVTNIANFLNIKPDENDSNDHSLPEDEIYYEIESQENAASGCLDRKPSAFSNSDQTPPASLQVRRIFRYIWSQMRSNNDVVCYCFFVLIFLWNFSLLSMIYLAALFLYALCVNSGPSYIFWVVMLIYTEINILLQYLYQIIIQHCGLSIHIDLLQLLGFPENKIKTSFVISTLPLFLVYVSTLLQSSITAKDGEWAPVLEFKFLHRRKHNPEEITVSYSFREKLMQLFFPLTNLAKLIARSFSRYWMSLTRGSESPPYFVQLSMMVNKWPDDGIQPQKIESGINRLLKIVHEDICHANIPNSRHSSSRVRIQSIERSQENSDIALAILEVMYASPLAECPAAEWYWSLTPASDVAKELLLAQSSGIFEEIGFSYPVISVIGGGKKEVDLYAYIFGVDLTVFFLVAIFYQSVIKNINKLLDVYQLEDQFPKEFVFILMVLFFLIVLDRIIYLCSFTTAKIILYLLNIFLFTYSVTRYAWYMQPSHKRIGGFALRAIYLTKAVSLALQAVQIRYGIPNKSTLYRQFLTSKVSQINYLGFRLYRALPFLYELRCVLDWSCTTTSLTMYDWLKLEDIYSSLFLVKCDAVLNRASHKQGQKQSRMTKFCSGICLFFILICVIWAPMLMYSSGNPTNIANPIKDVSVHIDIKATGGRLTPFQTALCEILPYQSLELFDKHYLETFNVQDIQLICCQSDSSTMWLVPPVVQQRYIRSLNGTLDFIFTWVFMRERPKGKEAVKYESFVEQSPDDLKQVLNGTEKSIRFLNAYPRYFRVTSSGEVRRLEQTDISVSGDLFLNHGSPSWWSFHDANALRKMECEGMSGPLAIVVSEETPQGILGETLSKFSIWSLYITFVLAVGRFIRLQCSDIRMRIPYEDLPSCDRLIAICEGIYAARAEGELEVEEVLYSTLVKIYRSPDMLLKYTNKLN
ncbi:piezo-type mechanosensitive ion channel homolog isoform X9 [Dendrobium catenatum]|uniref:piezo-type mechanosensitive ion channel homolog isoform X9 n=1 Tax=Dendrobium catenatum TaxID=906689 RepID=UPI0009F5A0AB|nr:piezo-type mechanosensitive ion channel homolog isoform X9 [Dendrobium catenatum]